MIPSGRDSALDKLIAANPSNVPTIWEQGLWDQEDMYGAIIAWEALKAKGKMGNNHLVMGPWRHSQVNREGRSLGAFPVERRHRSAIPRGNGAAAVQPVSEDGPPANLPAAAIYNTGENRWDSSRPGRSPAKRAVPRADAAVPRRRCGLGFARPRGGSDSYVSDPASRPAPAAPGELR